MFRCVVTIYDKLITMFANGLLLFVVGNVKGVWMCVRCVRTPPKTSFLLVYVYLLLFSSLLHTFNDLQSDLAIGRFRYCRFFVILMQYKLTIFNAFKDLLFVL